MVFEDVSTVAVEEVFEEVKEDPEEDMEAAVVVAVPGRH